MSQRPNAPLLPATRPNSKLRRYASALRPTSCGQSQSTCCPLPSQHRIFIASSIGHSQLYVNKNSRAASITNKVSNSSAKRRTHHQISPLYSVPPSPLRHFLAALGYRSQIDNHSEGLLMAGNQNLRSLRILDSEKQNRRMSFMNHDHCATSRNKC